MITLLELDRLMRCFPRSIITQQGEFIAHREANEYFFLKSCETQFDIKCKVIEWFSRGAFKTEPFNSRKKNHIFHEFMRNGINEYLGTNFTADDLETIYTYLGNGCNHEKTIEFVNSGYDIKIFNEVTENV